MRGVTLWPRTFILVIISAISQHKYAAYSQLFNLYNVKFDHRLIMHFDSCLYWCMRFFATLAINQTWTLKAKLDLNNVLGVGRDL